MSRSRSVLVLFLALIFGLSFTIPAEDIPETPYDESETLPYESIPVFANVVQESAQILRAVLTLAFPLHFNPTASGDESLAKQWARAPHPICGSVTIRDHSLRC